MASDNPIGGHGELRDIRDVRFEILLKVGVGRGIRPANIRSGLSGLRNCFQLQTRCRHCAVPSHSRAASVPRIETSSCRATNNGQFPHETRPELHLTSSLLPLSSQPFSSSSSSTLSVIPPPLTLIHPVAHYHYLTRLCIPGTAFSLIHHGCQRQCSHQLEVEGARVSFTSGTLRISLTSSASTRSFSFSASIPHLQMARFLQTNKSMLP